MSEKDDIVENVRSSLKDFFKPRGIKPTLRTMFYRLYSLGIIPNTKYSYHRLGKFLVDARKDGIIPWDAFSDGAKREVVGGIKRWDSINDYQYVYRQPHINTVPDPIQEAEDMLEYIEKLTKEPSYYLGRWYNQPEYVEVWIEKDAMSSTILSFLKDMDVYIAVNKGYSSWTFLHDNAMRLLEQQEAGKQVHVLYCGDFDPSGLDMEEGHLAEGMQFFGLDIDFHRISVNLEQIKQYNLPEMPNEKETVEKAMRDPRLKKFVAEYGRLLLVEVDAMLAIVPDEFKNIIRNSVDEYFDEEIYEETKKLQAEKAEKKRRYLEEHLEFI